MNKTTKEWKALIQSWSDEFLITQIRILGTLHYEITEYYGLNSIFETMEYEYRDRVKAARLKMARTTR